MRGRMAIRTIKNGNLNPAEHGSASNCVFGFCRSCIFPQLASARSPHTCRFRSLMRFLLVLLLAPMQKGRLCRPFCIGASNGNRTRIASLGSWSFTIRLYPRTRLLYIIGIGLSRVLKKIHDFFKYSPARMLCFATSPQESSRLPFFGSADPRTAILHHDVKIQ